MRNFFAFTWEILKIVIIALLIVVPIRYFVFQPFFVRGQSMEPNFENGDYLIVDEISYRFGSPQRGEVVVFKYPQNPSLRYIKRIVGLPGETIAIEAGSVVIFNEKGSQILDESDYFPFSVPLTPGDVRVSLDENEYFVLGDNRVSSADSRRWGPLDKENIVGRVLFRTWPLTALTKFEAPSYE
jgi:signal peptidase I